MPGDKEFWEILKREEKREGKLIAYIKTQYDRFAYLSVALIFFYKLIEGIIILS